MFPILMNLFYIADPPQLLCPHNREPPGSNKIKLS